MDFSRRQFLQLAGAGGALAVQAGWSNSHVKASPEGTAALQHHGAMPRYGMRHRRHGWKSHGGTLSKFVDRLPVPEAIHPSGKLNGVPQLIDHCRCHQRIHRDLPPTMLWGYDGHYQVRRSTFVADSRSPCDGSTTSRALISCRWLRPFTARNSRRPRFAPSCTYTA
jgi:hypothetical protein